MSLNIPQSYLNHTSSVALIMDWNTFSNGQKKNILKPITTGVGRNSYCATAMVSRGLSRRFKIPVCGVENSQLTIPKNLPDGHPAFKLLSDHYKLCKIISPEISESADEYLKCIDNYKLNSAKLTHGGNDYSGSWRLFFYHQAFDKKHYVQFKKDLVFPTQVGDEAKSAIDKLKNDQVNTLRLDFISELRNGYYHKLIVTEVT
tara:strand:- start:11851 stop:12459 length:609 start_codon:yes stop_codon:yes gene_type:complete